METNEGTWAQQQWGGCQLGDRRLTARAVQMGQAMARDPQASLPAQMGDPAALRGAYRLLNNKRVHAEQLWQPHLLATRQAMAQQSLVLLVQDRTILDYTHHPATSGLGPINGSDYAHGCLLHSVMAVVPEDRQVLGLAHAQVIIRPQPPGARRPSQRRASPEGQAWESAVQALGTPPPGVHWVYVSDRESDIYEYLLACRTAQAHFVVRAYQDRRLVDPEAPSDHLLARVRAWSPAAGAEARYTVEVAATAKQPKRLAQVVLQWGALVLPAPEYVKPASQLALWVVRAWEPEPPPGVEAVEWILLTSWPVNDAAAARRVTDWYTCRWLVEDYHQCLKTGCQMEASQLDEAADLQRLLGFLTPLAIRLLQLRQAARLQPDQLALQWADALWVRLLAQYFKLDPTTLTNQAFFRAVARLGGHLGRTRDGAPGWRTLWKGWHQLSQWVSGARMADS
jgi:transposase-like protein/transposase Tn5 family protein